MTIRKGDKIRCREDIKTHGLIHYKAPFTGSFDCTIPAGTVLVVDLDPPGGATGFYCLPVNYDAFELEHVPRGERESGKYGGYSFVLKLADLGGKLEILDACTPAEPAKAALRRPAAGTESGPREPVKLIHRALAPLASLKEQEKYIIHGGDHGYLLPDDLLNTAINVLFEQKSITFEDSPTLRELKNAIRACDIPSDLTNSELILSHEPWIRVREKSREYLSEIGFDLEAWEERES